MQNPMYRRNSNLFAALIFLFALSALIFSLQTPAQASQQELIHGKLSGGLEVGSFALSPDGRYVVFQAGQELFSVEPNGLHPLTRLVGPLPVGGAIWRYQIAPDSSRVVYVAYQPSADNFELFSVPITGGQKTRLNGDLAEGGSVDTYFAISSNSSRVVYLASQEAAEVGELFSVPIAGGQSIKLNGPLAAGGEVYATRFTISPDSARALYIADQDVDDRYELYSAPITGGQSTKLNGSLTPGGDVHDYVISADSRRVIYGADQDVDNKDEIFSVPTTGGQATKLNDALASNGGVYRYLASPNSRQVIYLAEPGGNDSSGRNLYSVPITGGEVKKLNGEQGGKNVYFEFAISPDSSRVVYPAERPNSSSYGVFSAPIGGGSAIMLGEGNDLEGNHFLTVSPDSRHVVFRIKNYDSEHFSELYSVPIGGGQPTRLNNQAPNDGDVWFDFTISADGRRVIYRQDQLLNGMFERYELFSVPIVGGGITTLNQPLVIGGSVRAFEIGPDNSRVVYMADQDLNEKQELYMVFNSPSQQPALYLPLVAAGANP